MIGRHVCGSRRQADQRAELLAAEEPEEDSGKAPGHSRQEEQPRLREE